ncbi:MAG: hypothetical protein ACKO0W_05860 [Planctomycetota bacterium]
MQSFSTLEFAFSNWAPNRFRWAAWAKPVLFTYPEPLGHHRLDECPYADRLPVATRREALVVDLPGAESISCALALARNGFLPVPLFNATTGEGQDVLDLEPILGVLGQAGEQLAALNLPDDAPPAFLIDSRRLDGMAKPEMFDNRWMLFPQDFPSGRLLRSAGIESATVIRRGDRMRHDLRGVLRLLKREGVPSSALDVDTGATRELVHDLSIFSVLGDHIAFVFHGLRENSAGGFGGRVPMPQATSGGYM